DLPVIGDKLPSGVQYGIENLQLIVVSGDIDAANMQSLNALITASLGDSPLIPTSLQEGITFAARLDVGSDTQEFILPLTGAKSSISSAMIGGAQPPASVDIATLAMSASAGSQASDGLTLTSSGAGKSSPSSFSIGRAQLPPARRDVTAVTVPSS